MIAIILAAYRARRRWRTNRAPAVRYIRKVRPAVLRAPQGGRHAASRTRPSYSHPAWKISRRVQRITRPSPALGIERARRRTPVPAVRIGHQLVARESSPPRSTIADAPAWLLARIAPPARTVNASVRAWLAKQGHPVQSHRAPGYRHRRAHLYLPNIGWCWETDAYPTVKI